MIVLADLIRAEAALQRATAKVAVLRDERDELVRQAVVEGALTQADVARATGLSRGRIAQITSGQSTQDGGSDA